MNETGVEIRSLRAARIVTFVFAVPCFAIAILSCLSPFMTVFYGRQPTVLEGLFLGVAYFVFGTFIYWPTAKFLIRVDNDGITYHTGLKCKNVRWDEIASYYLEQHQPHERFHSRLIFLDAKDEILLKIPFVGHNNPSAQVLEQRRELWRFVDEQLNGKKIDAPYVSFEPEAIVARGLDVDWKSKTVAWKIARCCALVAYALFWFGVMAWLCYLMIDDTLSSGVAMMLCFLVLYLGPLLPYIRPLS